MDKFFMSKKGISRNQMRPLCLLCCLVYFVSYLTRLNYAVCMVEIQGALQVSKSIAGLPVTASFFSYGAGQIICGILGDRYRPQRMILTGITGSAFCNLLAVSMLHMEIMIPAWFVNGFFQSMLWPPLVRIMAENLDEDWYRRGCVWVSLSSSGATVVLYLLAPLCIQVSGWKTVFYLAIAAGLIAAFTWFWNTARMFDRNPIIETEAGIIKAEADAIEVKADTKETESDPMERKVDSIETEVGTIDTGASTQEPGAVSDKSVEPGKMKSQKTGLFAGVPIICILLAIVLHGTLKDGIITWMPVYMTDMFGMSSSKSILSTAVLPICSVFSTLLSSALLYRLKNEVLTASLLFGTGTIAGIAMLAVHDSHPVVCVIMMMLITGCMYGVNLMLISRVPGHFAGRGNVSTVSGVLNAATYTGSALSTYVFGAVAENAGWMPVVIIWGTAALGGALLLLSGIRKWSRFCHAQKTLLLDYEK